MCFISSALARPCWLSFVAVGAMPFVAPFDFAFFSSSFPLAIFVAPSVPRLNRTTEVSVERAVLYSEKTRRAMMKTMAKARMIPKFYSLKIS